MSSYSAAGCQSSARRIVRSSTPMAVHTIGGLELWLDRAARERPDALAVNDLTYRELDAAVSVCARALASRGIGAGDRVATTLSGVDFAVLLHALPRLGAVLVPINRRLTPREQRELAAVSGPSLVVETLPVAPRSELTPHSEHNPDLDDVFAVVFTSGP